MTPLILIPGLLCDGRLWSQTSEALADLARCEVPDLAACDSIPAVAETILSHAPREFALAGFSLGGLIALEVWSRAPERVSRLALLSVNAGGVLPAVQHSLHEAMETVASHGLEFYLREIFPRYVAPANAGDEAVWKTFCAMGLDAGPEVAVRQIKALLDYPGFARDLGGITCPVALICGREDHRTPVSAHAAMAQRIPGAALSVIEGSGHFTPLEGPHAVADALRQWLVR